MNGSDQRCRVVDPEAFQAWKGIHSQWFSGAESGTLVAPTTIFPARASGRAALRLWSSPEKPDLFARYSDSPGSIEREQALLAELLGHGILVPAIVAWILLDARAALLTRRSGGITLDRWLTKERCANRRREGLAAVARSIARLHAAGFQHGSPCARHVLIDPMRNRVTLLDVRGCRRRGSLSAAGRAGDVAELFVSLPHRHFSSSERVRWLREYLEDRSRLRPFLARVRAVERRLRGLGCQVEGGEWSSFVDGSLEIFARQSILVNRPLDELARESLRASRCVRQKDDRRNRVWDASPSGDPWFGKEYRGNVWFAECQAWRDWFAHESLTWAGIATSEVCLVARWPDGSSVIWTRAVRPGVTLRDRWHAGRIPRSLLHRTVIGVATMVRRMHRFGFRHGDLYLDHFLEQDPGGETVLIDLSRVREVPRLSRRDRVHELAQLDYSARTAALSRGLRLLFLRHYLGDARALDRSLMRSILARADEIESRERRAGRFPVPRPVLAGPYEVEGHSGSGIMRTCGSD